MSHAVNFMGQSYEAVPMEHPRMATCGYCNVTEEASDMRECYNCTEHTCAGCHTDTGRCSYCGVSDAEIRIMRCDA